MCGSRRTQRLRCLRFRAPPRATISHMACFNTLPRLSLEPCGWKVDTRYIRLYDMRLYGSAMCCVPRAPAAVYVFQLSTLYDVIESWVPAMHKLTTMNLLGLVPRFLPLAGMTVYPHHRAASSTGVLFPALPGPRCALLSPSCVHLIRCPKPTRRAFSAATHFLRSLLCGVSYAPRAVDCVRASRLQAKSKARP